MAKKVMALLCVLCMLSACALCENEVTAMSGVDFYPQEENWTYRYEYSVPQLTWDGQNMAALLINDTLVTALSEMRELVLPMFAHSEEMTKNAPCEIVQDYVVTCNDDHFFSVLIRRMEKDQQSVFYTLDSEVFDVSEEYPGETLTLRGVVMVGESSEQLGLAVMPVLYEKFCELQKAGVCRAEITREEFEQACSPTLDYYADQDGNAVFFLQPSLMTEPSFDVPVFVFTPEELETLAKGVVVPEE